MCKGLPGSGKSFWAREQVAASGGKTVRINKDDLRSMLNDGKHSREREKMIVATRDTLTCMYLTQFKTVIIDDTNFAPEHEKALRQIAYEANVPFEVKMFDTPLGVCIERNRARTVGRVPEKFILETWMKYVKPVPEYVMGAPYAVIFDLDGTLALLGNRSPYDASSCEKDTVNQHVYDVLSLHAIAKVPIILMSGRDGKYREQTERWLDAKGINYNVLFMRDEGDTRPDEIIKRELYEANVKGKYNVVGVYDDRPKVCRMWQYDLGLPLFNVGYNLEF